MRTALAIDLCKHSKSMLNVSRIELNLFLEKLAFESIFLSNYKYKEKLFYCCVMYTQLTAG